MNAPRFDLKASARWFRRRVQPVRTHPTEFWRTAFYFDCRSARHRARILRHGFDLKRDGNPPPVTRSLTGYSWFPLKLVVREVRGLPSTDWYSYALQIMDAPHDTFSLPWGVITKARLHPVGRKSVRRTRQKAALWWRRFLEQEERWNREHCG